MAEKRLTRSEENEAIADFALFKLPEDSCDDKFEEMVEGCTVLYRDDYDADKSYFQVVDASGHGDGTGDWHEVLPGAAK